MYRSTQLDVLDVINSFNDDGVGVTRQTIAASLSVPINEVTAPVKVMLDRGTIKEDGFVHGPTGKRRRLLWVS